MEEIGHLRVELGAEGRHLHALKVAFDELFGLPCSVCTGAIED